MKEGYSDELLALVTSLLDYGERGVTSLDYDPEYPDVFSYAIAILTTESIEDKCKLTFDAYNFYHNKVIPMGDHTTTPLPPLIPSRPPLSFMTPSDVGSLKGKASKTDPIQGLMRIAHSQAHIESYAIDLSWDILVRFCHPQPPCFENVTDVKAGSADDYTSLLEPYFYTTNAAGNRETKFLKAGSKETFLLGEEHAHITVPGVGVKPKVNILVDPDTVQKYTITHDVTYDIGPNLLDQTEIVFSTDDVFSLMDESQKKTDAAKQSGSGFPKTSYLPPNTHMPVGETLPEQFFVWWLQVAQDEARHYLAWQKKLLEYKHYYGVFPVHNALWGSCVESRNDLIHRLSLVHLIHEAFGLDCASRLGNQIKNSKDQDALRIFGIIQRDEVTHVKAGLDSLDIIAKASGLAPIPMFHLYARTTHPPRPPFNAVERMKAGMSPIWYLPLVVQKKPAVSAAAKPSTAGGENASPGSDSTTTDGKRLNVKDIMAQRKLKQQQQQQPSGDGGDGQSSSSASVNKESPADDVEESAQS